MCEWEHALLADNMLYPIEALHKLLIAVCPAPFRVFSEEYGAVRLLARNHYVMEKAFVFAMICLTKWLGTDIPYPWCVPDSWPPDLPEHLRPKMAKAVCMDDPHLAHSQPAISYIAFACVSHLPTNSFTLTVDLIRGTDLEAFFFTFSFSFRLR